MNIEEFLEARMKFIEEQMWETGLSGYFRTAIEQLIANNRAIIKWHKNWPILVDTPPVFESDIHKSFLMENSFSMRVSQQMVWLTQEEYKKKFGSEPPTAPLLKQMAQPYRNHPDFREEWTI